MTATFYKIRKNNESDLNDYWLIEPGRAINFYFNGSAPVVQTFTLGTESIAQMVKRVKQTSDISYEAETIYNQILEGLKVRA